MQALSVGKDCLSISRNDVPFIKIIVYFCNQKKLIIYGKYAEHAVVRQ